MLKHAYLIVPTRCVLRQDVSHVCRFLSVVPSRRRATLAKPDGYEKSGSKKNLELHSDEGHGQKGSGNASASFLYAHPPLQVQATQETHAEMGSLVHAEEADVVSRTESSSERLKSSTSSGVKSNSNSNSSSSSNAATDASRSSPNKSQSRAQIPSMSSNPDASNTSNVSILKEDKFKEVLKEAQEAMANAQSESPVSLMWIRERVKEWKLGKVEEEEVEMDIRKGEDLEVDRDWAEAYRDGTASSSCLVEVKTRREGSENFGTIKRDGIDRKPRNSNTSISRLLLQKPPIDPTNPYADYVLPIFKHRESQRIARMRRNDKRNLSFIEAEAKLGMTSELYNAAPFGQTRGGKGKKTERWRKFLAVQRFERETGEKAMWVSWNAEPKGPGRSRKEGKNRGMERKVKLRGRDSFARVWGDLASSLRREPDANTAQVW